MGFIDATVHPYLCLNSDPLKQRGRNRSSIHGSTDGATQWLEHISCWMVLTVSLVCIKPHINGKSHSLEILITRHSHYVFTCTKQKMHSDVCLTSYCPLHIYLSCSGTVLFRQLQLLLHARSRVAKQPEPAWYSDGKSRKAWKVVCPLSKNSLLHNSSNQPAAVQHIWQSPSASATCWRDTGLQTYPWASAL